MAGPVWIKLGRNVPWEVRFKNCSQNLIPSKTLVCRGKEIEFFKQFFRNLLLRTLFKNCSRNFDPSINMALVNQGLLQKKFLINLL